ncbi:helix-turn-helix domain-containing protein [Morganella morganii]|uniref:Helix-turn-helix transcriptional regulator n=1 Tax=Morganella morganii TaxID=582 RepID=A0AAE4FF39_MORMO|nr:helix-turn-helix transcriptional regulator [Morganella morganii]AUU02196.1 XRE family transcriptional regulator [Morganella morganii]EKL3979963.1 helix-turn-helix transcriptional regulator [Morganella morganii]EKW8501156.1 helix-turn-helix transcriptional regulator [Morganella morganii]ELB1016238.1 helix-turn-helix transcriptional regulator [Morganella morganii]ELB3894217.1 helix-turn-helix transcriptional regulator [Morganella morganii]
MALTEFGKAVRIARLKTDQTLLSMAEELEVSPAFLSGLENGRKKVSKKWVKLITSFFDKRGYEIENLQELADISNEFVELDGLSMQQKMLVAGFAKSPLTPEQLRKMAELLKKVNDSEE